MTKQEKLLINLIEECNEVSQRASKAIRFGMDDVYDGKTNQQRIIDEFNDIYAVMMELFDTGIVDMSAVLNKQIRLREEINH